MKRIILMCCFFLEFASGADKLYSMMRPLNGNTVLIITEAPLFREPSMFAPVLTKIPILEFVVLLSNREFILENKKEEWYFIGAYLTNLFSYESAKIKGWLERKYIAGIDDFKPAKRIQKEMLLISEDAEDTGYYRIYSNGIWAIFFEDTKTTLYGQIYQCLLNENVYLLGNHTMSFFIREDEIYAPFATKILTNSADYPNWIKEKECPLNIGGYYTVIGNDVPVRSIYFIDKLLLKLKRGTKVKLLEWMDKKEKIGDKTGYWARVDTGIKDKNGDTIKGWILDVYIEEESNSSIQSTNKLKLLNVTNSGVNSCEKEDYHILTGDNVNVRSEASTNSAVLLKLKKGARVKLLERSDVTFTIGDRTGYWVYIDTGVKDKEGNTIKGWVVDIYLKEE
ncbi:SH3 domain-containing protein [Thermospira aquatica]|uniref:SH3 domain-containing protein n=1 Tax=Thermospira aquatica TaxID=2828656 RepID=A0AAX3BC58_9SPIR|nr:SH3 domain-containing protein [Thermospira aquatica]URA09902.1 SH3 domain-containing protein [Thermospira aquatica]